MDFYEQILNLLGSLEGVVAVGAALGFALLAVKSQSIRWLALSATAYVASLNKFSSEWIPVAPPLFGPIETLVQMGRPLAITGLLLLLLVSFLTARSRIPISRTASGFLFVAQMMLVIKVATEGSMNFAGLMLLVYVVMFYVMTQGVSSWLCEEKGIEFALLAVAGALVLFLIGVAVQSAIDPSVMCVANGRLNATTGNSQHAAVLLAGSIPAVMYQILRLSENRLMSWIKRLLFGCVFLGASACLAWTGSRTGMGMWALEVLIIIRSRGMLFPTIISCALAGGGYSIFKSYFVEIAPEDTIDRISELDDTRSAQWDAMWRGFIENPLFGEALVGDRVGFGENSWLAMASNTGVIGLIPLLLFGAAIIGLLLSLFRIRSNAEDKLVIDVIMAGLLGLMVGSVLEGYLLGVITLPVILIQIYALIGSRLIILYRPQYLSAIRIRP